MPRQSGAQRLNPLAHLAVTRAAIDGRARRQLRLHLAQIAVQRRRAQLAQLVRRRLPEKAAVSGHDRRRELVQQPARRLGARCGLP